MPVQSTTNTTSTMEGNLKQVYPRTRKMLRGCKKDCKCKNCSK